MSDNYSRDEARSHGHEPLEVDTRAVWMFAGVLIGTIVAALAVVGWLLWFLSYGRGVPIADPTDEATPRAVAVPDLDANQLEQLRALRGHEQEMLSNYVWTDPQTGIARVPIQRAMQIVSERGLESITFPAPESATQSEAVTGQPAATAETPAPPNDEGQPDE